jgi:hypothetical protein
MHPTRRLKAFGVRDRQRVIGRHDIGETGPENEQQDDRGRGSTKRFLLGDQQLLGKPFGCKLIP